MDLRTSPDDPTARSRRRQRDGILWRVIAAAALLIGTNLWMTRHMGVEFLDSWKAAVGVALAGVAPLTGWLLEKAQRDSLARRLRQVFRGLLSIPLLTVLYACAVWFLLTHSSIVFVQEANTTANDVVVTPVDGGGKAETVLDTGEGPLRYVVPVTPFGRAYRVQVAGYVADEFDVFPFSGRRLKVSRDLRRTPSLLFRPSVLALASLEDGGRIVVWREGDPRTELARDIGHRTSFVLGTGSETEIPAEMRANWPLELAADPSLDEANRAQTRLEWQSPTRLSSTTELQPGMTLTAEIWTRADAKVAEIKLQLPDAPWVDAPLKDTR